MIRWFLIVAAIGGCYLSVFGSDQDVKDIYHITDGVSHTSIAYTYTSIPRGTERELANIKGPGKVTYFYFTPVSDQLVLKVYWDGDSKPSINVPLSDFFGALHNQTIDWSMAINSTAMVINHKCYMCYLPMPFSSGARFVLANDSDKDFLAGMAFSIDYERDQQYATEKSRLHCSWRRSNPVQDGAPPLDKLITSAQCGGKNTINTRHTILEVNGRGQYVGNFLKVCTKSLNWWGEGCTFITVDGETMVNAAGTEDSYGSSWGFGNAYSLPYCGYMPISKEKGNYLLYHWYLPNPIRFQKSLKVEIADIRNRAEPGSDDFTSVAYWYQDGVNQNVSLQPYDQRTADSKAGDDKK